VLRFRDIGSASCREEPDAVTFRINVAGLPILYRLFRDRRNPGTHYVLPGTDGAARGRDRPGSDKFQPPGPVSMSHVIAVLELCTR
jgi:hypothetical protein